MHSVFLRLLEGQVIHVPKGWKCAGLSGWLCLDDHDRSRVGKQAVIGPVCDRTEHKL